MTDRELLELAAKAAGIPLRDLDDQWDNWEPEPVRIHRGWNPIEYDGDALRLAVKLEMCVDFMDCRVIAGARPEFVIDFDGDYRRAIVRASGLTGSSEIIPRT